MLRDGSTFAQAAQKEKPMTQPSPAPLGAEELEAIRLAAWELVLNAACGLRTGPSLSEIVEAIAPRVFDTLLGAARQADRMRWVPVGERMPEGEPRFLLAWCEGEHARSVWHIPSWHGDIGIGPANTPATHWQEMPAPPAAAESKGATE